MTSDTKAMLELWRESGTDIQRRHAQWRLSMPRDSAPSPEPLVPLAEALALHRLMNACQFRGRDAVCGCSGHRCALRAAIVSHRDCLECVRVYGA